MWWPTTVPAPLRVSIPQRSDLNISRIKMHRYHYEFQSRNGLIWTGPIGPVAPVGPMFQSRNGLIWTLLRLCCCVVALWFQSRNGLIWTLVGTSITIPKQAQVSIPQRSDLNPSSSLQLSVHHNVSIPQRSDLNIINKTGKPYYILGFNPATVWFEQIIWK